MTQIPPSVDANIPTALPTDETPGERLRWSPLATSSIVLAIGVLIAVDALGAESGVIVFPFALWLTAFALGLALLASLRPGPIAEEGLFILADALGLSVGLLAIGFLGVSSMLGLVPILAGIAMTAWPRWPGQQLITPANRAVLIGGAFVFPIAALGQWLFGIGR